MIDPLIVTARLDPASFAVLDGLRRRHFPSHLNKVPAHISLFHKLPGHEAETVVSTVLRACRGSPPLELEPEGAQLLGRGVALAYRSAELTRLHGELAKAFRTWLTPQDRQPFRAHVTVQNKADPAAACALHDALRMSRPPSCRVDGLAIWRYLGGPWEALAVCPFDGESGRSG